MSEIEWPREIWMAEREEYDQGVVTAVLSEHATLTRFEGDTERDREFHRYVDGDIHDSAEKYWRARLETQRERLIAAVAKAVEDQIHAIKVDDSAFHSDAEIDAFRAVLNAVREVQE